MEAMGISEAQALDQIELFKRGSFSIRLSRPCTVGDGVQCIPPDKIGHYMEYHGMAARKGRFSKFVPASGAASRMFQSLLQIYHVPQFLEPGELHQRVRQGVAIACDFQRFLEELHRFPFFEDLNETVGNDGQRLDELVKEGGYCILLDYLLTNRGLNYGSLPKALLKFHRYPGETRTAFEEHLVESRDYLSHDSGGAEVHFTVPPEHEAGFKMLWERVGPVYEERYGIRYSVSFSFQRPSTDTIAAGMDNLPFRDRSGSLHFRPGGHGALLENLSELGGDFVYIKNIDNVVQDRFKPTVTVWKKVLGGCLAALQDRVHGYLRRMEKEPSDGLTEEAASFARDRLLIQFPWDYGAWPAEWRQQFVFTKLNRPIRVCGVVRNAGEPGGAPFWVQNEDGDLSLQIVEQAQVDLDDPDQRNIWRSSTHFNPVDLVCAVKDFRGKFFDLTRYVDPGAVLISKKNREGRELKALELPGLWNGSMADWNTVFVEVPMITFNPVKTFFDLLRAEHQEEF